MVAAIGQCLVDTLDREIDKGYTLPTPEGLGRAREQVARRAARPRRRRSSSARTTGRCPCARRSPTSCTSSARRPSGWAAPRSCSGCSGCSRPGRPTSASGRSRQRPAATSRPSSTACCASSTRTRRRRCGAGRPRRRARRAGCGVSASLAVRGRRLARRERGRPRRPAPRPARPPRARPAGAPHHRRARRPARARGARARRCSRAGRGSSARWAAGDAVVGLRADIDALPLRDEKDVAYRSQNKGVCHACGHDVHTAVVLGAGLALASVADRLPGRVRLMFQHAEEMMPGGALDVIAEGHHDGPVGAVRAALRPVPRGRAGSGCGPGRSPPPPTPSRSGCTGPGGHTSRPHNTVDLVHVLATVATGLPDALSRLVDPRAGLCLVWGQVEAGQARNAIPREGTARGHAARARQGRLAAGARARPAHGRRRSSPPTARRRRCTTSAGCRPSSTTRAPPRC